MNINTIITARAPCEESPFKTLTLEFGQSGLASRLLHVLHVTLSKKFQLRSLRLSFTICKMEMIINFFPRGHEKYKKQLKRLDCHFYCSDNDDGNRIIIQ